MKARILPFQRLGFPSSPVAGRAAERTGILVVTLERSRENNASMGSPLAGGANVRAGSTLERPRRWATWRGGSGKEN